MVKINNIVGFNMKKIIRDTGNTQESASALLNIKRTTLTHYLNGVNEPSIGVIYNFCKVFNITPNELLGFDNISNFNTNSNNNHSINRIFDIIITVEQYLVETKRKMTPAGKIELIEYIYKKDTSDKSIIINIMDTFRDLKPELFLAA